LFSFTIIGLLAQVVDATATHYSLELLAKLQKIVLEKDKTILVGGKHGSFESNPRQVSTNIYMDGLMDGFARR